MKTRSCPTQVGADQYVPSATFRFAYLCCTVLPEDLLKEAVPGNIRKAEHFVAFLKRFVEYLKVLGLSLPGRAAC